MLSILLHAPLLLHIALLPMLTLSHQISLFLRLTTPCKIWKLYDNPFWEKSNRSRKKKKEKMTPLIEDTQFYDSTSKPLGPILLPWQKFGHIKRHTGSQANDRQKTLQGLSPTVFNKLDQFYKLRNKQAQSCAKLRLNWANLLLSIFRRY